MMYWVVFSLTFLSLLAREGKRAARNGSDKPVSRLLARFYRWGHRNCVPPEENAQEDK